MNTSIIKKFALETYGCQMNVADSELVELHLSPEQSEEAVPASAFRELQRQLREKDGQLREKEGRLERQLQEKDGLLRQRNEEIRRLQQAQVLTQ